MNNSEVFTTPLGRMFVHLPEGLATFLPYGLYCEDLDSARLREAAENLTVIADLLDAKK